MQKKKISFLITKATWGGAQRYVYDLATRLPPREFSVEVAFGQPGTLAQKLSGAGIPTHTISSMSRDVALMSDVASFFQILVYLWRSRPDIVHLNSSKAAAIGAVAARILGIRIVFTVHGWPFKEPRGFLRRWIVYILSWLTAILSSTVIVVSKSDEEQGQRMWGVTRKIHYIPIGIDAPHVHEPKEALRLLTEKCPALKKVGSLPRIITIAELTPNKGLAFAIQAVALLKKQGVRTAYLLVGDGEQRAHLKSLARSEGVEDDVFFTGFVEDAAQYLKAGDVFLLPSVKEGTPYVLIEAAAAGLPIITTTAVNPDVAATYENVRAVSPGNAEALARTLLEHVRTDKERELFPEFHFSLSKMLAQTEHLYNHI